MYDQLIHLSVLENLTIWICDSLASGEKVSTLGIVCVRNCWRSWAEHSSSAHCLPSAINLSCDKGKESCYKWDPVTSAHIAHS